MAEEVALCALKSSVEILEHNFALWELVWDVSFSEET